MTLAVGDPAPEFTLKDTDGNMVSLSELRDGSAVTLVFIPFAFTGVCQGELCELRDNLSALEGSGTRVVAVSCDASPSQKEWRNQQDFGFPLLSDFWPHGEVARAYGCFLEERGCAERATFVIDAEGTVVDTFRSGGLGEARELSSYTDALAKL